MHINGQLPTKCCNICKQDLPMFEFYRTKNMVDGLMNRCIACLKKHKKPNDLDKIRANENTQRGF